jgi:P-type Cu+ transporter
MTFATDPVCGMSVETAPEALRLTRDNRTYYFCCPECLRTFAAPAEARRRLARRLVVAWPLAVATVLLAWGPRIPQSDAVAAVLAGVVQVYVGSGFYAGAAEALRRRSGNMDLLVAVGSTTAYVYSLLVVVAPGHVPGATYFDASALIVTVILTGNYLEVVARRRASSALRALAELLPASATVVDDGADRSVPLVDLAIGQRVRVAPGDRVPVDGVVRHGTSAVEQALLTGESGAVRKTPGDRVLAGSRNLDGPLVVEATAVGPDAYVAQVGRLLEEAELARVPLRRQADRLASVFVPFVLALAVGAAALWLVLSDFAVPIAVLVFVTVAVTACPCAFGLATPAALLVGTGTAAETGVLFRGGDAIERAARIDTVLTDKTGTLTQERPVVEEVVAVPPHVAVDVLGIAAGLERGIRHPLAAAIALRAGSDRVPPSAVSDVGIEPGSGVRGSLGGHRVALVGTDALAASGIELGALRSWAEEAAMRGRSVSVLTDDGSFVGALSFSHPPVPDASAALAELRADGVRIAMVTGDSRPAALSVAATLGVREVYAGVAPEGKVALVRELQGQGRHVAFVGDGVNDAPALAAADLGVAIGTGAEVARESGQVLLVRPEFSGVPRALRIARRTVGRVRSNLLWAVGYNAILLPVAAGALVPLVGLHVYTVLPVLGAAAMGLSSTTVLLNSMSLRWSLRASFPPPRPSVGGMS